MTLNTWERWLVNNPARAFVQRHVEARILLRKAGRIDGKRALEIGCGRGVGVEVVFEKFGAGHVTAVDIDPKMVERSRRRLGRFGPDRLQLVVAEASELPFSDASFDAVFDFGIIHHVPVWQDAIAEVSRVLRPGGLFLFEEVSKKGLDRWLYRTFLKHPRENRFSRDEFLAVTESQGIRVEGGITELSRGDIFIGAGRRKDH